MACRAAGTAERLEPSLNYDDESINVNINEVGI